jgi:hypothetical protein
LAGGLAEIYAIFVIGDIIASIIRKCAALGHLPSGYVNVEPVSRDLVVICHIIIIGVVAH